MDPDDLFTTGLAHEQCNAVLAMDTSSPSPAEPSVLDLLRRALTPTPESPTSQEPQAIVVASESDDDSTPTQPVGPSIGGLCQRGLLVVTLELAPPLEVGPRPRDGELAAAPPRRVVVGRDAGVGVRGVFDFDERVAARELRVPRRRDRRLGDARHAGKQLAEVVSARVRREAGNVEARRGHPEQQCELLQQLLSSEAGATSETSTQQRFEQLRAVL